MTSHQIPIAADDELETAYRPFQIRFTGAVAEVESELALAVTMGRADWCNTLRDIHDADLAQRAPFEMLKEFAHHAPSPLLSGYVLGIMFSRNRPEELEIPPGKWVARANRCADLEVRGAVLGCAFMSAFAGAGTLQLTANRPSRSPRGRRSKGQRAVCETTRSCKGRVKGGGCQIAVCGASRSPCVAVVLPTRMSQRRNLRASRRVLGRTDHLF